METKNLSTRRPTLNQPKFDTKSSAALKGALLCAIASLFAMAAGTAYAADQPTNNRLTQDDGQHRTWTYSKKEISKGTPLIRIETDIPNVIVPLDTDFTARNSAYVPIERPSAGKSNAVDFTSLDLVEESPVFIGAYQRTEFDTLDALRNRAAMPSNLNVDPMVPVAGAGVKTTF